MPENIAFKETTSLNNSPVTLLSAGLPSFDTDNPFTSAIYPFDADDLEPLSPLFQTLPPTPYLNPFENEENNLEYNTVENTQNNVQCLPPLSTVFSTRTTELYPSQLTKFTTCEQNNVIDISHDFTPGMAFVNNTLSLPELNHLVFNDINSPLPETHSCELDHNLSTLSSTPHVKSRKINKIPTRCTKARGPRKKSTFPKELGKTPTVNSAFQKLRKLIPTEPVDRRLSKVETLRLAVSYIQHLGHSLETDSWVEQPCLLNESTKNDTGDVSTSICTFCMSKRKVL